jgi:hypothetical protein
MGIIKESSSDFEVIAGRFQRRKGAESTRGLNRDYNRVGKWVFKSAAKAAVRKSPSGALSGNDWPRDPSGNGNPNRYSKASSNCIGDLEKRV